MCHLKLNDLERKKNAKLVVINRPKKKKKEKEAKCKMPKQKSEYGFPAQVFQKHFINMRDLLLITVTIIISHLKQIKPFIHFLKIDT